MTGTAGSPTIGLDVGATTVKGLVVDADGVISARQVVDTPSTGTSAEIEDAVVACIASLHAEVPTASRVGLAVAGWIGADRRSVVFSANFPAWQHEPLADRLAARTGLPVVMENDANAAAWGEFVFGAGADTSSMVAITLGSGWAGR